MKDKSQPIRESYQLVATPNFSIPEIEILKNKVRQYQERSRYVYEFGIIKRNLAYTLDRLDQI